MNKITIPALQKPEDSGKRPGRGKDGTGVRYRRWPGFGERMMVLRGSSHSGSKYRICSQDCLGSDLALPCTSCMTFGKFLNSSVSQLSHFKMEIIIVPMS